MGDNFFGVWSQTGPAGGGGRTKTDAYNIGEFRGAPRQGFDASENEGPTSHSV